MIGITHNSFKSLMLVLISLLLEYYIATYDYFGQGSTWSLGLSCHNNSYSIRQQENVNVQLHTDYIHPKDTLGDLGK